MGLRFAGSQMHTYSRNRQGGVVSLGEMGRSSSDDAPGKFRGHKLPEFPEVTCWCEAHVVRVTWDDVRHGRTCSCGRRECRP